MTGGFVMLCIFALHCSQETGDYPIQPVPFTAVTLTDSFWQPRLETNRRVTIPYIFEMDEITGRVDNLRKAAGLMEGPFEGRRFNDSDVFKAMEAAAYSLALHPDPVLEEEMDRLIDIIAGAQESDGYLYAARTVDPANPAPGGGSQRWIHLQGSHELYNAGHLYEAASAYYQATGKRQLLDIALKNAALINRIFGPGKRRDTSGHQEIEIGLAKLFRITGRKELLALSQFFLDERGRPHDHMPYPESVVYAIYNGREYRQDHLPVLEQYEAVGHSVRAAYQYAAMADIAALTGNKQYVDAIDRIWQDIIEGKLYLTGGIGARHTSEAFGEDYELPNRSAYTETCAAVGNVFWNHRMFLLHGHAKYYDVLERTLYNGLLSGVSLKGDRFFYQNPLESEGDYERSDWFACSCCPGNIARLLPALPGYIYATAEDIVYINLFIGSEAQIATSGGRTLLTQATQYPWDGHIRIQLDPEKSSEFSLAVRIPGWVQGLPVAGDLYRYRNRNFDPVIIKVNGTDLPPVIRHGYAWLHRKWDPGDTVTLHFPMVVRQVVSHDSVTENRGKTAYERGPLVYCAESADHGHNVLDIKYDLSSQLRSDFQSELLGGVMTLHGTAFRNRRKIPLTLIPYYAWANRGSSEMAVWLPSE